ncbi:hypothetical protein CASFOL_003078 [Castilleja foliolosa]|uniref:F-box domain-containing protein n=1 Tax=Castilleja foliolosa TaxID=1961234 RepID=A0ABD3EGK8_9LAMI
MSLAIENQADQRDEDGDKISQLPEPILHHILYLLSQKDAVRTCVLSKSWSYHWCARPLIDFRESCSGHPFLRSGCNCKRTFLFFLDKTLQRYHDQNLSVHELRLEMSVDDSESNSLLEKWIPKFILPDMCLKILKLFLHHHGLEYFDLLSILLKAETLQELYLRGCKLSQINSTDEVRLKCLQKLTLDDVNIANETLEMILSSSPLLESVSLFGCTGFKAITVCKSHGLKDIAFADINDVRDLWRRRRLEGRVSIEIDIPTIEKIRVTDCWFHHYNYLPYLTSLFLNRAGLSKSIDFLSGKYLPCLEHLTLDSCYLPQEFDLRLSGSVKRINFINTVKSLKASIDAPNIVMFVYRSEIHHSDISFTTTSSEWKSDITVDAYMDLHSDAPLWFHKLSKLLKVFSQSEISFELNQQHEPSLCKSVHENIYRELCREHEQIVEVEHFSLKGDYSHSRLPVFLKCLFRIFRPRYMEQHLYFSNDENYTWKKVTELTEFLMYMFLIMEKDERRYYWPRGLEEVTMVEFDEHARSFDGMKARFQLEWVQS